MEPLFLKGVLQDKIWGGTKLRDEFGYDIPSETTGELWAISAHPNGPATVKNGQYAGKTLLELWDEHRELFGDQEGDVFPLLTKIIDAQQDLSVQVHPGDGYALQHEGELGKSECWYVLDAEPGAEIVFGHNAESIADFRQYIEDERWDELLRTIKVQAGDFFYVPSGTVHAIGSGLMVLETQQSSDTTYRLYDYNRRDDEGNLRDLHIEQAIDVTTIPHQDQQPQKVVDAVAGGTLTTLVTNEFFTVFNWEVEGPITFQQDALYTLVSVIEGEGQVIIRGQEYPLKKGDHFLLPNEVEEWTLDGDMQLIASQP